MKKLYCFVVFILSWIKILSAHEGFLENTLVLTPSGYQKIQDLYVGDIVYDQYFKEKIITNSFEYFTDQYIQLNINDEIINCAPHQKLYVPEYATWMQAYQLTDSECNTIETIHKDTLIYCITVQDHIFQISQQNIITHNSAAVIMVSSVIFNFIELSQPVMVLLGITQSLCYFSSYAPQIQQNNTITYQASLEKNYFDSRYQKLQKLKQEITIIHAALKTIKCQFQDQYSFLDYQKLIIKNLTPIINITAQYEAELDFEERLQLTDIRKKILEDLEIEICNMQIVIGSFINEILHRKNETIITYNNFIQKIKDPVLQQTCLPRNTAGEVAVTYYEHVLSCIMYIAEIENRTQECKTAIKLFEIYKENKLITQTTNIIPVLTKEKDTIEKSQPVIDQAKKDNQKKLQATFDYCTGRMVLPNITHKITALKNDLHQKINQNTTGNKTKQIYHPHKPNPNSDDDAPRYYEQSSKHPNYYSIEQVEEYLAKGISPSPQNGQAKLQISLKTGIGARVTTENGYIVIFYRTEIRPQGGSIYHGFITTFDDLEKRQRSKLINFLVDAGLMKRNGKIL